MLRSTKCLCGSDVWGPITGDGLELTPCAREIILNAAIPLCIVLLSVINLIVRQCRGQAASQDYDVGNDPPNGHVPVSKYDIGQLVISFFHLGFIGFLFGWRMDEYDENAKLYLIIGAIGQFSSWLYIIALIACHFMTRKNQTQHAYLRHLLLLYAYFVIVACINLRSILKHDSKGYELVFSIWDAIACCILLACSLKRPRNPELKYSSNRVISHDTIASLWSLLSFAWMTPIIKLGNSRVLTEDDLWELPSRCQAARCYGELERMSNMDLLSRLLAANATNLISFVVIAIFRSVFAFTTPFFLYRLLKFISSANHSNQYSEVPYLYVFGILLSELLRIVFLNQLNYQLVWLGVRVEQMLSILVYKKQLRMKTSSRSPNSRTSNILTTDVDDIAGFFSNLPFIITIPLEILVATVFLYVLLDWSSLVGVGIMILCLWSNKKFGRRVTRLQKRVKKARDERVGEIFELLHAVRMIKMFAWERSFHERLMSSRKKELSDLRSLFWRTTVHALLVHLTPFFVTLCAFAAFTIISGETLTAAIAFTSITLFNTLKQPLQIFPNLVVELVSLGVAIGRVERFLHGPDVQRESSGFSIDPAGTSIRFDNVEIAWSYHNNRGHNDFKLNDIDLEFPLGKTSLVCGSRFSGKSLLMLSLLRETFILRGIIHFPASSIAYVPQQAWLENATIRDNILFGEPFDNDRYWNVVDSCCLSKDFEDFEEADFTEYDEKNMVLSDGQKARIALARALYSSARILLIDDCLSPLDANTARQIIDYCLNGPLIDGRTVIMVTQYVRYFVDSAAYIVILVDGSVQARGSPEELREAGLLTEEVLGREIRPEPEHIDKNDQNLVNQAIEKSVADKKNWAIEEVRFQGKVKLGVYCFYFKSSGGIILWFMLVLLFIIIRLLTVGETYLLVVWSKASEDSDNNPVLEYIKIYALIALASAIFTIIRMACQFFSISLKGSRTLFSRLLNAILRAPLSFFDSAPLGRVMNRFSKDLGMVDQGLVTVITSFLGNAIGAISVLVVVSVVTYEFSLVSVVVIILYLIIGSMYINVSRELKRLQSITRSPVLSWYSETTAGIATIRAFSAEHRYVEKFIERLNTSNRTTYLLHMSNRWMSIRMGSIGAVASYLAGIFILQHYDIDAGLAGFCLSYALGFVQIVFMLVKDYTTMETSMSSVERIKEYIEMPQESPAVTENIQPPAAWPTSGKIKVSNLTVKYSPQFEPVLRDISFTVNAEEKIGIVGRTGSGKTTLANSFLRLNEATEGRIIIDDIDISNLGLEDLRSRLTIISQDPILFEGTIRSNLDIRSEYFDDDIWIALRRVHLVHIEDDFVIGPISSLEDPVNEGGSNFSRGQRQLLCLARALLRQSKIVIMDEATASIDPETVNKIQETIKNEFNNATVLCISHRFKTIIHSDRILVLNEGKIAEFDTPYRLINNTDSLFRHLCEQTGELGTLMELARSNHPEEESYDELEEDEETPGMEIQDYETEDDIQEDQQSEHEVEEEEDEEEEEEEEEDEEEEDEQEDEEDEEQEEEERQINAKGHNQDDREV